MSAFASKSIVGHLTRGFAAVVAFFLAFQAAVISPWLALGAVAAGVASLRGCPICWSIGLVETLANRPAARVESGTAVAQVSRRKT